ncbi:23 kDa integral membrane protein-like [Plodia interpunctella]|uniref:23 kDa integral membrane protein-like n=1 Tax=Plodia interpunctella TaxID=58824 RepID=UPI00236800FA|nr:23 kDa integral membrane protein-like [Plodia interpunctella]
MTVKWMEFTTGCAKGILLVLNVFCIILAVCVFGFAVVDTKILKQYGEEHAAGTFTGDLIVIVASLLLIVVAVFGVTGVLRSNVKMLYLYVGFLLIIVILELMIAIFVAVQRYGLEFRVTEWLREDFFRNVTDDEVELHAKLWDNLQTDYECCGLNGPEDYRAMRQRISLSCCPRAQRAKTPFAQQQLYNICVESASYYASGCEDEILFMLRSDADWLLGAAALSFWFEVSGMLLAMWIANNLKNSVQVYKSTVRY